MGWKKGGEEVGSRKKEREGKQSEERNGWKPWMDDGEE